jgi:hypothetical protein
MSIVSLVIAPTLAQMHPVKENSKINPKMHQSVLVVKK